MMNSLLLMSVATSPLSQLDQGGIESRLLRAGLELARTNPALGLSQFKIALPGVGKARRGLLLAASRDFPGRGARGSSPHEPTFRPDVSAETRLTDRNALFSGPSINLL